MKTQSLQIYLFRIFIFFISFFFYRDAPFLLADIGFNSHQFIQQIRQRSKTAATDVCLLCSISLVSISSWEEWVSHIQSGAYVSRRHLEYNILFSETNDGFLRLDWHVCWPSFRFQENSNQMQMQQNHFRPQWGFITKELASPGHKTVPRSITVLACYFWPFDKQKYTVCFSNSNPHFRWVTDL